MHAFERDYRYLLLNLLPQHRLSKDTRRDVETALREVEAPAPASFEVVDRYTGAPLREDQASVTVRVMLQPQEKSLTDAEIESYRLRLIEVLEKRLGLTIRSGN